MFTDRESKQDRLEEDEDDNDTKHFEIRYSPHYQSLQRLVPSVYTSFFLRKRCIVNIQFVLYFAFFAF